MFKMRNVMLLLGLTFSLIITINISPTLADEAKDNINSEILPPFTTQQAPSNSGSVLQSSTPKMGSQEIQGELMVVVEITVESEASLKLIQEMGYSCEKVGTCLLTIPRVELDAIQSAGFKTVVVDQAVRVNLIDNTGFSPLAEVYQHGFNGTNYNIPDDDDNGTCGSTQSTIEITGAPSDAVVTNVRYRIQVNHTFVSDLWIVLMNQIWSYDWVVWDFYGSSDDGGYDDDPEYDQDIYMDRWIDSAWDGDPVNQTRILAVYDCVFMDTGYIDFFELWVYYEESGDSSPPTINWLSPVGNGETYSASSGTVNLEVSATDTSGVDAVEFWRWDDVNQQWIVIKEDLSPPYQASVNVGDLNIGMNRIDADAYDSLGNGGTETIWIDRTEYCYTLTRNHTGSGSDPTASPSNSPGCPSGQYVAGASIDLTANPSSGWHVGSWSGTNNDSSTSTSNTVSMPASNHTVTVNYEQDAPTCYTLTRTHTGSGSDPTASPSNSTGCPSGQYVAGASINLTVSPSSGWHVASWSGTNNDSSTSTSNTVSMPASNHTVTVNYEQDSPSLLVLEDFSIAKKTDSSAPNSMDNLPEAFSFESNLTIRKNPFSPQVFWLKMTNNGSVLFDPLPRKQDYQVKIVLTAGQQELVSKTLSSSNPDDILVFFSSLSLQSPNLLNTYMLPVQVDIPDVTIAQGTLSITFIPGPEMGMPSSTVSKPVSISHGSGPSIVDCLAYAVTDFSGPWVGLSDLFICDNGDNWCRAIAIAKWIAHILNEMLEKKILGTLWDAAELLFPEYKYQSFKAGCLKAHDAFHFTVGEENIQGALNNSLLVESPIYPHVISKNEQRTGFLENGQIVEEIPGSRAGMIGENRLILFPGEETAKVQMIGYDTGIMNFTVTLAQGEGQSVILFYENIPVVKGMRAMLISNDNQQMLEIDSDGDGQVDQSRPPDKVEFIRTRPIYLPIMAKNSN